MPIFFCKNANKNKKQKPRLKDLKQTHSDARSHFNDKFEHECIFIKVVQGAFYNTFTQCG